MTNRLKAGLFSDPKVNLFNLSNNQIRKEPFIKNAHWFNYSGEKLGKGDLSFRDLETISSSLFSEEKFFILSEYKAFYDLPKSINGFNPGKKYMFNNASHFITCSDIYKIQESFIDSPSRIVDGNKNDYIVISRDFLKERFDTLENNFQNEYYEGSLI